LQALTLALPEELALRDALIDIDGDGYLEQTQWLATEHQALAVDTDGNAQLTSHELLNLSGAASLTSLGWLDANGDQVLDARDPAFAALRFRTICKSRTRRRGAHVRHSARH
jgi:hypothetical protein